MNWDVPLRFLSEAVIQAEFYMAAQQIGLRCTLELSTSEGRLDIAVFNDDWTKLLAIVECKNNLSGKVRRTRQIERYKRIGVPVYGLGKAQRAMHLAKIIKESNHPGIALESVPWERKSRRTRKNSTEALIDRLADRLDEDVNFRKQA